MPIPLLMPALSPTMTEGNLARWLKKVGDPVKAGDVLAEIETDKATMEVEAVDEGVLGKILVADGTAGVKVNEPIALILADGESAADLDKATTASVPLAAPTPAAAPEAPAVAAAASGGGSEQSGDRVFASPLARVLARQGGVDLAGISGSGPHGRIVKADVEAALASGRSTPSAPAPVAAAAPAATAPAPAAAKPAPTPVAADLTGLPAHDLIPHTSMRKVIARRLLEAKTTIPHFYLTVDIGLDALMALRAELNVKGEKAGYKLSVNDFVIRASALALKKLPDCNASWTEEGLRRYHSADVSVAVSIAGGLITPIIRGADGKGLAQISNEMKDLAKRARDGKLKPEEYQGGTFSVSNLGMFGIREFAAIINPPQAAILAVGAGEQRAVVEGGAIAVRTQMTATLSVDHRVIDGALGAEYLSVLKGLIEDPMTMLL